MSVGVDKPNTTMAPEPTLRKKIEQIVHVARLKPFDTSTTEGRATERLRRAFWTAATSALAKGINTVAMLVSVPITLGYLGNERYGLWMTITAIVAFLGFADLGIGNVILNFVSEASGQDDEETARKHVSNAFFMLTLIAAGLALLFVVLYPRVNWNHFFNLSSPIAIQEAGPAVIVFMACFLVNLPLSIIPRIQMGYQEGYLSSIWLGISNVLGLAGLLLVVYLEAGLPWLVLVVTGAPALGNLLNGVHLFVFLRPSLMPRWQDLQPLIARQIVGVGVLFLILQITSAITYSADNVIITRVLGPEAVTEYAVPAKLFLLIPNVLFMFLSPLWPAYGEASARGDHSWAKRTLIRAVSITFAVCAACSLFLILFGEPILALWTGSRVVFSLPLMLGLGAWTTLSTVITAISLFLNAMNRIRFRVIFALLTTSIATLMKIVMADFVGVSGVVWSQVAVSLVLTLIPYTIYVRYRFYMRSDGGGDR